mmetsp:Transcript_18435/g.50681  ORF Transcript_18435/g.50681 Transcript_18435/m.50681 type:complete len:216 (+) Transcript_18435:308-955(+)
MPRPAVPSGSWGLRRESRPPRRRRRTTQRRKSTLQQAGTPRRRTTAASGTSGLWLLARAAPRSRRCGWGRCGSRSRLHVMAQMSRSRPKAGGSARTGQRRRRQQGAASTAAARASFAGLPAEGIHGRRGTCRHFGSPWCERRRTACTDPTNVTDCPPGTVPSRTPLPAASPLPLGTLRPRPTELPPPARMPSWARGDKRRLCESGRRAAALSSFA